MEIVSQIWKIKKPMRQFAVATFCLSATNVVRHNFSGLFFSRQAKIVSLHTNF
jgi:hypothetical protein